MKKIQWIMLLVTMFSFVACNNAQQPEKMATKNSNAKMDLLSLDGKPLQPVEKSEAEWKKELSPLAFQVLRESGTERAFTGETWDNHEKGIYVCGGGGLQLRHGARRSRVRPLPWSSWSRI